MTQKTLLALGGSRLLIPIIDAAHDLGHRVVTCDFLPDNVAHASADDYRNVSIVEEHNVLNVAREVNAVGVLSFAADPGVVSAAFAAEHLKLPFQGSHHVVRLLQSKDLFRNFLAVNGFKTPLAHSVSSPEEATNLYAVLEFPVIVKPVDSAGSKGVTRVDEAGDLTKAVEYALRFSIANRCIIETFIETDSRQLVAEGFTINGEFVALAYMDHVFDESGPNPHAPIGHIFPSQGDPAKLNALTRELQRLANLLDLGSGIYNIEARISTDGTPYIMEVSPRGGGNRLSEFVRVASGVDLIRATVQAALGDEISPPLTQPKPQGVWLQQVLFSREDGTLTDITIDPEFRDTHLRDLSSWIALGEPVSAFRHASYAFGSMFLQFNDITSVEAFLAAPEKPVTVSVSTDALTRSNS